MSRVATAVWRASPDLVLALEGRLGSPVDSYVNGTQTWLTDDGPGGITLEWRLHPVGGYRPPARISHYELWEEVVGHLAVGVDAAALRLGGETRPLSSLWDGLECFAAYGDDIEPAPLAVAASAAVGLPPTAVGLVDHEVVGDEWERSRGSMSLVDALLQELES
jgi:hypothetical protein